MNIREYFSWDKPYYLFNREERNLCAILYHLLLTNNNLPKFLDWIKCRHQPAATPAIYFEYSQLRDIWHYFDDDSKKRSYILDTLRYPDRNSLRSCSIYDFNAYFGAVKKPSEKQIQSPRNWAISHYHKKIADNDELLRVSRFKWCFNAKPDIVIHLGNAKAVCIEGKYESREGLYPGSREDRAIFKQRRLPSVPQREIQRVIFDLLGIDCEFVFLVADGGKTADGDRTITWHDVFSVLDLTGAPEYIHASIDTCKQRHKRKAASVGD